VRCISLLLAHLRRGGPARECPLLAKEQTCGRPTENWTTRSALTASGRRRKVSYVASGCEDIDL
jgi:hypothetical protein